MLGHHCGSISWPNLTDSKGFPRTPKHSMYIIYSMLYLGIGLRSTRNPWISSLLGRWQCCDITGEVSPVWFSRTRRGSEILYGYLLWPWPWFLLSATFAFISGSVICSLSLFLHMFLCVMVCAWCSFVRADARIRIHSVVCFSWVNIEKRERETHHSIMYSMLYKPILLECISRILAMLGFQGFSALGIVESSLGRRLLPESQVFQRISKDTQIFHGYHVFYVILANSFRIGMWKPWYSWMSRLLVCRQRCVIIGEVSSAWTSRIPKDYMCFIYSMLY